MYTFQMRTGEVQFNRSKCNSCTTYACVKACSYYGRGILRLAGGQPELRIPPEETKRLCNECLACEWACESQGQQAITITLPISGLDEYKKHMRVLRE